ncbi:MAG TPA: phage tail protein [Methylophilaceae bacterium]|nr:phage tail protein [Methylophilaceae bacterium]HQR61111.1 phage tail protein [Methylophilaceae bacterium]
MAIARGNPYGAFNFQVSLDARVIGGFSDVSGIGAATSYSEYREGTIPRDTSRKTAATQKYADVVLKRGLVDSASLSQWLEQGLKSGDSRRNLTITLLDEAGQPVAKFHLCNAQPQKWVGPTLAAKGGDVAMEELHLTHEGLSCEETDSHPRQTPGRPPRKP